MEHYSALKRNKILTHVTVWMTLSEISHTQKDKYYMIPLTDGYQVLGKGQVNCLMGIEFQLLFWILDKF